VGSDRPFTFPVIPAKAGIQLVDGERKSWIPAFAGMTGNSSKAGMLRSSRRGAEIAEEKVLHLCASARIHIKAAFAAIQHPADFGR
jgi:hypothetical protein